MSLLPDGVFEGYFLVVLIVESGVLLVKERIREYLHRIYYYNHRMSQETLDPQERLRCIQAFQEYDTTGCGLGAPQIRQWLEDMGQDCSQEQAQVLLE